MELKNQLVHIIQTEIENMPNMYMSIAQLKYYNEFTVEEISDILSLDVDVIEENLLQIDDILETSLDAEGISLCENAVSLTKYIEDALHFMIEKSWLGVEESRKIYHNILEVFQKMDHSIPEEIENPFGCLAFDVQKEGEYLICLKGDVQKTHVRYYEQEVSLLQRITYVHNTLMLVGRSTGESIDFQNSYLKYGCMVYDFPEDGILSIKLEGCISLYLQDYGGIQSEYEVEIRTL